jgi:hypothetical protein
MAEYCAEDPAGAGKIRSSEAIVAGEEAASLNRLA